MTYKSAVALAIVMGAFFTAVETGYAAKPGSVPRQRLEQLPANTVQGDFSVYKNAVCGISFAHPADWKESKPEEKEGIVKFAGTTKDGLAGDFSVSRFEDGTTPRALKAIVENAIFPKLPEFNKLQEKKIAIGPGRKLPADLIDATFTAGGIKFQQRYVFFELKSGTFSMVFSAPAGHFNTLAPIFNNVLLSVQSSAASTGSTAKNSTPSTRAEKAVALKRLEKTATVPVSFSYPEDWVVARDAHHDEPVTVSGRNARGQAATIVLNRGEMHPCVSIEEVADGLQKEYFEPLKQFHRVNRQTENFGVMSKVNGVVQQHTFEKDGSPVKQMVAMFYHGDKTYALSLLAPGWKDSEMHQLFSKVLATVEVKD